MEVRVTRKTSLFVDVHTSPVFESFSGVGLVSPVDSVAGDLGLKELGISAVGVELD